MKAMLLPSFGPHDMHPHTAVLHVPSHSTVLLVCIEMINENRNVSKESSIMQRSYNDVAKGSGMSDTKQ